MFSKRTKQWCYVRVMEPKPYLCIPKLLLKIFEKRINSKESVDKRIGLVSEDPRRIAPNIAPVPPPSVKSLIEEHQSRFRFLDPNICLGRWSSLALVGSPPRRRKTLISTPQTITFRSGCPCRDHWCNFQVNQCSLGMLMSSEIERNSQRHICITTTLPL